MNHFLKRISLVILFTFSFSLNKAQANLVDVNYTGTITTVDLNPYGLNLTTGLSVTGSFTYDSSAAAIGPGTDPFGGYGYAFPTAFTMTIDGIHTISLDGSGAGMMRIGNDVDLTGFDPTFTSVDYVLLNNKNLDGTDGPLMTTTINGTNLGAITDIESSLGDTTGTVFSTDSSLPTSLDLNDFNFMPIMQLTDQTVLGPKTAFEFTFDSFSTSSAAAVPEPSHALMLLIGFGILYRFKRNKNK